MIIQSVSFQAHKMPSGATVQGTITLNAPAPAAGLLVLCSTDDPQLKVAKTVLVPPGQLGVSFEMTAGVLVEGREYRVYAQAGHQVCSTVVEAAGTRISHCYFDPQYVASQGSTTLTVTLANAAPVGGALVFLREYPDIASMVYLPGLPASVLIAEGDSQADILLSVAYACNDGYTKVQALYGGTTIDAFLYVDGECPTR